MVDESLSTFLAMIIKSQATNCSCSSHCMLQHLLEYTDRYMCSELWDTEGCGHTRIDGDINVEHIL